VFGIKEFTCADRRGWLGIAWRHGTYRASATLIVP